MYFEEAFLKYYKVVCPTNAKMNEGIVRLLSASVCALATQAELIDPPPKPCTFFIALVGRARSGKSTLLRYLEPILCEGGIKRITAGSPEHIAQDLDRKRHSYLVFDEADRLVKLAKRYMDTLPFLLNQIYYRDSIQLGRTTKKTIDIEYGSYFTNVYFAALPEQWKEIEELFGEGFQRRVLVLNTKGRIPWWVEEERKPEEEAKLLLMLNRAVQAMTKIKVKASVRGLSILRGRLEAAPIPETKKSTIEEYLPKVLVGRVISNCFEIRPEDNEEDMIKRFFKNLKSVCKEVRISQEEDKYVVELEIVLTRDIMTKSSCHPERGGRISQKTESHEKESQGSSIKDHPSSMSSDQMMTMDDPRMTADDDRMTPLLTRGNEKSIYSTKPLSEIHERQNNSDDGGMTLDDGDDTDHRFDQNAYKVKQGETKNFRDCPNGESGKDEKSGRSSSRKRKPNDAGLFGYIPPLDFLQTFHMLLYEMLQLPESPEETLARNVEKLKEYREQNPKKLVVSMREFVRKVLRLGRAEQYFPVLSLLQDGGYIRIIKYGRYKYVVLDPLAHICANCPHFGLSSCKYADDPPKPTDPVCDTGEIILLEEQAELGELPKRIKIE